MVNSENQQAPNDRDMDDVDDGIQRFHEGDCREDLATSTAVEDASSSVESASNSRQSAAATEEAHQAREEDLLQRDRVDNLLQWLRALDVQVMGACRADERRKPLLKLNVSTGAAEDRLLSHLSQHFEPLEVGMLARCLCVPLVSIRVGKVSKLGSLLRPTASRGNLNLTLQPTSDLRLSFIGDDGLTERLVTLTSDTQCSVVEIEGILADDSGRSFLIKIPNKDIFYFWCSEKSMFLGNELLGKMKDLLKRKPCLAELTGISESRLGSFAIHLRAYLVGSTMTNARSGSVFSLGASSVENSIDYSELGHNFQSSTGSKSSRSRQSGGQGAKPSPLYQGSLSPRPSSFKEGVARNASLRTIPRERIRRRGESYVSCIDNLVVPSTCSPNASSSNDSGDKFPEAAGGHFFPPPILLKTPGKSVVGNPTLGSAAQVPLMGSSLFSPYYCWCPPVAPAPQCTPGNAPLFTPSESLSMPTSLLSVSKMAGPLTLKLSVNQHEVPPLDFPPCLPDPLVMLPLSLPASQQIPTFTPLMCDPIVHIPVIDVCSSGQGYLVPAISTAIPPMHPNLASPLIPEADSVVEKNARETLRMLINSSNQPNPSLIEVLPSLLTKGNEMQSILAAGSRGLYGGTKDVDAIAFSMAAMGLVSTDRFVVRRCTSRENVVEELENSDCPTGRSEDSLPKSGTI